MNSEKNIKNFEFQQEDKEIYFITLCLKQRDELGLM